MPEYTPGLWDAHDGPEVMAGDWERHVATCWNNDKVTPDEALANARLIARAPLLLKTLEEVDCGLQWVMESYGDPAGKLASLRGCIRSALEGTADA
jgi:hypothetical protein